MPKTIAIIGAGAKAAAIVARASVIRELPGGESAAPRIVVFEKDGVGAAWSGSYDYTNGELRLCTPGEKDVGFPYLETALPGEDRAIASLLHARFSWSSFLAATGRMANWVDRGRQHPSHKVWAHYLSWVFDQAGLEPTIAEVERIFPRSNKWIVSYKVDDTVFEEKVDGVVLTGSGTPAQISLDADIPPGRVLDAKTFWPQRKVLAGLESGTIAVAGSGGAAGAIIAWLAQAHADRNTVGIHSLSPMGTLFPRGDGYSERRWFSDPSDWQTLERKHRDKLIERTDSGVISLHNKDVIDRAENVEFVQGAAKSASWNGEAEELVVGIDYPGQPATGIVADYLINAIGFDKWSVLSIVDHPAIAQLLKDGKPRKTCEETILPDLSLAPETGAPPNLHVPSLGVLQHGPGMSNLGCLGLVAKAVLRNYTT